MYRNSNNDVIAILNGSIIKFVYRYGYDHLSFSCRAEAIDYLDNNGWEKD